MNKPMSYTRADGYKFDYNGSLTVNVYQDGKNIDCFTLGYPAEQHTIESVTSAMDSWGVWDE